MRRSSHSRGLRGRSLAAMATCAAVATVTVSVATAAVPARKATKATSGLATAAKKVQALYHGGLFKSPPKTGPKPQKGKSVWEINVGLNTPSTDVWSHAIVAAGNAMGWHVKVFDGQDSPQKWLEGIQEAIAAKADGIVLVAIDCGTVKAGLQQARAAHVKVVDFEGADCSQVKKGAPSLFSGTVRYAVGRSLLQWGKAIGAAQADWIAVKTKGKGQIIDISESDLTETVWQNEGFLAEIRKICPGCKIVRTVGMTLADLGGTAMRQKISQALLQNPAANAIVAPYDDVFTVAEGDAAIVESGRKSKLNVVAATGLTAGVTAIKKNLGLDATIAYPFEWEAWAAMDTLNRVFHGERAANSGLGLAIVDRGHNDVVSATGYAPPVNFKAAYLKAWGVR